MTDVGNLAAVEMGRGAPIALEIATLADAGAIRALYAAGGWQPHSRSWQDLDDRLARGEVGVLRDAERVVGSVATCWEDPDRWDAAGHDGTAGYVHALVRDRERTPSGVGGGLLTWAEARIAARGRRLARLDTPAVRIRLVRYYQEHGYRLVGTRSYAWRADPLTLFEKHLGASTSIGALQRA